MKRILALMIIGLIMLSGVALAKSYCPANSLYRCNCPNGRYETYTNIHKFKEARENPDSCCFYKPQPKTQVILKPIPPSQSQVGDLGQPLEKSQLVEPVVESSNVLTAQPVSVISSPIVMAKSLPLPQSLKEMLLNYFFNL